MHECNPLGLRLVIFCIVIAHFIRAVLLTRPSSREEAKGMEGEEVTDRKAEEGMEGGGDGGGQERRTCASYRPPTQHTYIKDRQAA